MTTQTEALKLALEALENNKQTHYYCEDTWYSCPQHEDGCANDSAGDECNCGADKANAEIDKAITAIKEALSSPNGEAQQPQDEVRGLSHSNEQVEPVAHMNQNGVIHEAGYPWESNNRLTPLFAHPFAPTAQPKEPEQNLKLMPREATPEMLKAMDECSMEGYDERLYEGHASSVYMAAWYAFTHPPVPTSQPKDVAQCANSDLWNCKYCTKTKTCEAINDHRNFGEPKEPEQEHVGVVGSWKRNENGVYITTILGMVELGFDDKVYTTPPHRKPLTHEQRFDLLTKFEPHKNKWEAPAILIDMVEAAHGIKE